MRKRLLVFSFTCLTSLFACAIERSNYDVIIRGGLIYDGVGRAANIADIAIIDDRIVAIGSVPGRAKRELHAEGLVVSPGFIDMHSHVEFYDDGDARNATINVLRQGVTTVVTGPDGFGTSRVAEYFDTVRRVGSGVNVLHTVGHNTVREEAMGGHFNRPPTPAELELMRDAVRSAMSQGAAGLSSGLFFVPGSYSETEEVIELARIVAEYGGIYTTHIRDEGDYAFDPSRQEGLFEAVEEAMEIGAKSGVLVNLTHIKVEGIGRRTLWGSSDRVIGLIEAARRSGQQVYADQYPYTAGSTELSSVTIPAWALEGGLLRDRLSHKEKRMKIRAEIAALLFTGLGPKAIVISEFQERPDLEGLSLFEAAKYMQMEPADTVIALLKEGDPSVVVHSMDEYDVENFMRRDYVSTSSDGGNPRFGTGLPHPRAYGAFPRKIARYVKERQTLDLAFAIRAATALPAEVLGLPDRGCLRAGCFADLVIFDPERISDRATFDDPHRYSVGIAYVVVNGRVSVEDDEFTGVSAGRAIRHRLSETGEQHLGAGES